MGAFCKISTLLLRSFLLLLVGIKMNITCVLVALLFLIVSGASMFLVVASVVRSGLAVPIVC